MIPKKIHYCWVGGNPLPESAKKCIRSWKKYCPDYEIIEWNETNYDFTKKAYMKEAYEAKKWGFVPDYARLDIIYEHGGIYLDVDVEVVKSFDDLLEHAGFAGFETEEYVNFGQGFGAEAKNPLIKNLLNSYEKLQFINPDGSLNLIASPELNTEVLKECGLVCNGETQMINGFTILPSDFLCPKSLYDGIIRQTYNTYSIHHFESTWFTKEQQQEKFKRWKEKQRKIQIKQIRTSIKNIGIKILGEKSYKKLRGIKE